MGWLKKLTKPISKVLDKIIPNEIKPALPYLSAFAPYMLPAGMAGGSGIAALLRRGALTGGINLASQLAQEGSEGEFSGLSALLAAGQGALTAPGAADTLRGMQGTYNVHQDPTFLQGIRDTGVGGLAKGAEFLEKGVDIFGKGGTKPGFDMATLEAAALPIAQGTGDLAMADARRALNDYNAGLEEGTDAWYDDNARRVAIRSAMEAAGHVEETILDALASLGLRQGGIVGLKKGGRIGYQEGELVEESEVVEESKGDNMLVEIAKVIFKLVPPTSFMFAAKDAYDMYQNLEDEDKQKVQEIGKRGLRFAGIPGMAASAGMSLMDKFKGKEMADGGMTSVLPRGTEMDYRGGGMIPMGSKERADDVPARLSKNEFVMTADAVRAAGGGSVNRGAKRMYDLMHNLEARV